MREVKRRQSNQDESTGTCVSSRGKRAIVFYGEIVLTIGLVVLQ